MGNLNVNFMENEMWNVTFSICLILEFIYLTKRDVLKSFI